VKVPNLKRKENNHILGSLKTVTRKICEDVKKKKEICATFAVTAQPGKAMTIMCDD
jgi:hypothetical protein